jgi:type IV fimbrial biogenesis protein FimT
MVSALMNRQRLSAVYGFTLTELAVTLVVAGVLAAVALPALSSFSRNGRVKQAANDMVMTLAYARNEAINRNAQVSVDASGSWSAGWQVTVGGTPLRQTALNGGVVVGGPAGGTVTYNPNGRLATSGTLSFTFSIPGDARVTMRCVSATLMGQPVLQADDNHDGDCSNG